MTMFRKGVLNCHLYIHIHTYVHIYIYVYIYICTYISVSVYIRPIRGDTVFRLGPYPLKGDLEVYRGYRSGLDEKMAATP